MSTFRSSDFTLGVSYYPDYVEDFLCSEVPVFSPSRPLDGDLSSAFSHKEAPVLVASSISESRVRARIVADLDAMSEIGLSVLRIGEFSWAHVEPEEGHYCPDRFLYALDEAKKRSLKVIFCTPTATPPPWLTSQHPDILPLDREGRTIGPGSRRHCNLASQPYLDHSRRITEYYAKTFGNHEAVCGFQIDNEFGCHGSAFQFNPEIQVAFVRWLSGRYESIKDLNRLWFGSFWSRTYSDFDQIPLPDHTYADNNPHLELEFRRFSTWLIERFQKMQAHIIRAECNKWVTHNFMSLFSDIDHWSLGRDLDYAGFDHYQMKEFPDFPDSLFQFYLMRSLKPDRPFLLLEQQPLQVNWQPLNRRLPYHFLFLWTLQAFFQGAGAVLYFSWQRFRGGAERMHDALISHEGLDHSNWQRKLLGSLNQCIAHMQERLQELANAIPRSSEAETAAEIPGLPSEQAGRDFQPDAVVFMEYSAFWAHDICNQSQQFQMFEILRRITVLLQSLGWSMAFCRSPDDLPSEYRTARCWIFPGMQFTLSPAQRQACDDFRKAGGSILSFPTTGQMDFLGRMVPSPLAFLHPQATLDDFGALGPEEEEWILCSEAQSSAQESLLKASLWAERIQPGSDANMPWGAIPPERRPTALAERQQGKPQWGSEGAPELEVLARFQGGLYAGAPAILRSNGVFHQAIRENNDDSSGNDRPYPGNPWVHLAAFPDTGDAEQVKSWSLLLCRALNLSPPTREEHGAVFGTEDCIYIPELLCFEQKYSAYLMHGPSAWNKGPGRVGAQPSTAEKREIHEEGLDPHRPALKYCLNEDLSLHMETLEHKGSLKCSLEAGQILILPRKEDP